MWARVSGGMPVPVSETVRIAVELFGACSFGRSRVARFEASGDDLDMAVVGRGVVCVDDEIEDDLTNLVRIGHDATARRARHHVQDDGVADEASGDVFDFRDLGIEVELARHRDPAAPEGEELMGQGTRVTDAGTEFVNEASPLLPAMCVRFREDRP